MKDYYLILGIPKTATAAEIDAAFRKLARKYHPDAQPEEEDALALFKSAMEAHEVLSSAEKRREYDRKRSRTQPHRIVKPRDPPGPTRHARENLSPAGAKTGGTMHGGGEAAFRRSLDIDAELRLVPEEAGRGGLFEMQISFNATCPACQGKDSDTGEMCENCGGERIVRESRFLQLRLPPQLRDGTVLCIAGQGKASGRSTPAGDLYLTVRVRPCW